MLLRTPRAGVTGLVEARDRMRSRSQNRVAAEALNTAGTRAGSVFGEPVAWMASGRVTERSGAR